MKNRLECETEETGMQQGERVLGGGQSRAKPDSTVHGRHRDGQGDGRVEGHRALSELVGGGVHVYSRVHRKPLKPHRVLDQVGWL